MCVHTDHLYNASTITNTMHTQILNSTSIEYLPLRWAISTIFRHFVENKQVRLYQFSFKSDWVFLSIFILLEFFCSRSNLHCDYSQCDAIDGWKATELAGKPNKHSMPTRTHLSSLFCCVCDATLMKFTTKMRKWARRVFFQSCFFPSPLLIFSPQRAWLGWNFNFCLLLRHESAQLVLIVPRNEVYPKFSFCSLISPSFNFY